MPAAEPPSDKPLNEVMLCDPALAPASVTLPDIVRFAPSKLLPKVNCAAVAEALPSKVLLPVKVSTRALTLFPLDAVAMF